MKLISIRKNFFVWEEICDLINWKKMGNKKFANNNLSSKQCCRQFGAVIQITNYWMYWSWTFFLFIGESRYTLHHLLIITVIVIMSSSYTNSLPVRQMVYDDPRCNAKYNRTKPHTKAELHNQIKALFDECNIVLNSTRSLAKDFVSFNLFNWHIAFIVSA